MLQWSPAAWESTALVPQVSAASVESDLEVIGTGTVAIVSHHKALMIFLCFLSSMNGKSYT